MSDKKNVITPFRHHSFVFLKMRITLSDSGRVAMKLSRRSIAAMRRKIDIFRRWVDGGEMTFEDVAQAYQSWRSHAKKCNSHNTLRSMDERFVREFAPELTVRKKKFPCNMNVTKTEAGWEYRPRYEAKEAIAA